MLNQKVLMSGADFFSNDAPINPYYDVEKIDVSKAMAEHELIKQAFEQAGIEVVQVPPPATSQDGVYTANWGLCRGEKCVLSRLPAARSAEEAYAEQVLAQLGKRVLRVPDGLKFSGQGDSLPCGGYLFAGSGYRSDPAAQQFVAATLGLELVQLRAVPELDAAGQPVTNASSGWPDSFFYDIDLAISVLREDLIAYCPEAFDEVSRAKITALPLEKIIVDHDEAVKGFACYLVSTGQTVIMSAHAPKFQAEVEKRGLKTITPEVSELSKGGGYIRCVSLTLD
jgi:N-dimethylarginine dimethylaminohydrolase